jgi:transglutaminase-like putative cysteine protease
MSAAKRYRVLHTTGYRYSAPVALSRQLLHLSPREFATQRVIEHRLVIDPEPNEQAVSLDYFGNAVSSIVLSSAHQSLSLAAASVIELTPRPRMEEIGPSPAWEEVAARLRANASGANAEPAHFLFDSPHVECSAELQRYAAPSFAPRRPLLEAVQDLNHRIHEEFEFDPVATVISTPLAEVLREKRGVCQDFAHLMIGCLRTLGLAARYVSGYLLTSPPPGHVRLIGADASHAWISLYVPGAPNGGWVDFDPTNDLLVDDEHITLGWGRDFSDVTPTRGVILGGGEQELAVHVTVSGSDEPDLLAALLPAKVPTAAPAGTPDSPAVPPPVPLIVSAMSESGRPH